jgi:serine phosphatase RsbU (regulator of sigma subunit)
MLVFYQMSLTFAVTMGLSALLVEFKVFKIRIGPVFYSLVAASVGVLAWIWTRPAFGQEMPLVVLLVAIYLVTLWQAIVALAERRPDAWLISVGFLILTLSVFASLLRAAGWLEVSPFLTAFVGLGALALCLSTYLTRRVAHTNRQLEAKLAEVETLTRKTIEQERWAAREEAERRVLEADNTRKTAELEEARQLQLAMLPREVPALADFDIGVHMATANEVGGDYYDFATNGDGSCTVAVGDATGHGLHAGMVVGAAKSLFQSTAPGSDLTAILARIETGLSAMHRREASMAMLLLRLADGQVELVSAGMPPVLVWRRATGAIEEYMLPSVPLGTLRRTEYRQAWIGLEPGDSLLVMTDGLAEVSDPRGDLLGYERAAELFADAAHLGPQGAIVEMVAKARQYQAGAPLEDDMTLVVIESDG